MFICKYYKPEFETLIKLVDLLYSIDGCEAGGPLHILLDDGNISDADIAFCIKECIARPVDSVAHIGILICYEYLKMTPAERDAFEWYRRHEELDCTASDCSRCAVLRVN